MSTQPLVDDLNIGRREICFFLILNCGLHILCYDLHLPMAHPDLSAYIEPGIQLAINGKLCGPASQYQDLTAVSGYYFYPPGFFLSTALWVLIFDSSAQSLLAMTLWIHLLWITSLWWILRKVARIPAGISILAICSVFPIMNHGRPDLLSLLFGSWAWLALPRSDSSKTRIFVAGLFSALAGFCSPAYGIGSSAAIAGHLLVQTWQREHSWKRAFANLFLLSSISLIAFSIMLYGTLSWLDCWVLARVQWQNHSSVRGHELNQFPMLLNWSGIVNCLIPLLIFSLIPILLSITMPRNNKSSLPFITAMVFEWITLFSLTKAYFLSTAHSCVISRTPMQSSLASNPVSRALRIFGNAGLVYYAILNLNTYKIFYLPLITDADYYSQQVASLKLPDDAMLGTDSHYFLQCYRPGNTLSFEINTHMNRWMMNRSITNPDLFNRTVPDSLRNGPPKPDVILIAAISVAFNPQPPEYIRLTPGPIPRLSQLFGRTFGFSEDPLRPNLFVRADKLDELLPVIRRSSLPLNR